MASTSRDEVRALREENARLQARVRELDDALCDRIYRDEQGVVSEQEISEKAEGLRAVVDEFAKFLFLSIPRPKHRHLESLAEKYGADLSTIRHRPLMRTLMPRHIWETVLASARLLTFSSGEINFVKWETMVGARLRQMQASSMEGRLKKDVLQLAQEICPWRASTVRLRRVIFNSPLAPPPNETAMKEERLANAWSEIFKNFPDHKAGAYSVALFVREGDKTTPRDETRLRNSKAKLAACLEHAAELVELVGSCPSHIQIDFPLVGAKGVQDNAMIMDFADTDEEPVMTEKDEVAHSIYPAFYKYGSEYGTGYDKVRVLVKAEVMVKAASEANAHVKASRRISELPG